MTRVVLALAASVLLLPATNATGQTAKAVKVTILSTMLVGNTAAGIGEWGFAAVLEVDGQRLLVDTGARAETVLRNAQELNIDLVPDTLLFIPLFQIVKSIGLLNSYWGMVLVYPTLTVPFCTWIMIGYFQSIPKELDEAALIDGAGQMQMLFKIFIPVALPGIIAATIFAFTVSWAAFVYPMTFLYSADQQVLTVGTVTSLIKADVYKWGMLMAGALVAAAPPLVIYAFLMDYYIAGLTAGATKG